MNRIVAIVFSATLLLALSCGDDADDKSDIQKACDIIVKDCGGEAKGFYISECLNKIGKNAADCVQCVIIEKCNYVSACHSSAKNCDLQ